MCSIKQLADALGELLAVDVHGLTAGELAALHLELDVESARLEAVRARVAAAFDARRVWAADGHRSAASWLAHRRRRPTGATRASMRLARRLLHMPRTDAALAEGRIGIEHARELAGCRDLSAEHFAADEEFLVEQCWRQVSWDDFLRVVARWKDAVDHERAEKDADAVHDRRRLVLHRRRDGSMTIQDGFLDPLGAEAVDNELRRIEEELHEAGWAEAREEHGEYATASQLRRTHAQRMADALVEMAHRSRTAPADGKRPAPLVSVYIDDDTAARRLCELESGAQIATGQALSVFPTAEFERVVFGPGNRVIELGLRQRAYTGGLRRAIELRDRHCQWPGCQAPVPKCQVDHRNRYTDGGYTTQWNGRLFCGAHNRARERLRQLPPELVPPDEHPDDDPDYQARLARQRLAELRTLRRCRAPAPV